MNKYITPLTENEVLAWQNDCLNPVNRFILVSMQETQVNVTLLFYGFRRFPGPFTPSVKVTGLSFKENLQV